MGHKYDPDYAVHPGETVKECMLMYGFTPCGVARRFIEKRLVESTAEEFCEEILEIIVGDRDIESRHVTAFSWSFRTTPSFWENRQKRYDKHLARLPESNRDNPADP